MSLFSSLLEPTIGILEIASYIPKVVLYRALCLPSKIHKKQKLQQITDIILTLFNLSFRREQHAAVLE